jgi:hypothetical protein
VATENESSLSACHSVLLAAMPAVRKSVEVTLDLPALVPIDSGIRAFLLEQITWSAATGLSEAAGKFRYRESDTSSNSEMAVHGLHLSSDNFLRGI